MAHSYAELKPEYEQELESMKFTRSTQINSVAEKLVGLWRAGKYGGVPAKTGVPAVWIAASFEREASSNFALSPAQGDRWDRKSVHVPANRGPFLSWDSAADDAYHIDGLDKVGAGNWSWPLCCYYGEVFNGFGYRSHGVPSPYLWGGTNIQEPGKYVRDGEFNANVIDQQLGIIPIMQRMIDIEPKLDFTKDISVAPPPPIPLPTPKPMPHQTVHPGSGAVVGGGAMVAAWLSSHIWLLIPVAIAVAVALIYLHRTPAPNQSPKAIAPTS